MDIGETSETFRIANESDGFVFPIAIARAGPSLSFAARGVLSYLLSQRSGWITRASDIEKEGNLGKDKRRALVSELERAGYFERKKIRNPDGRFVYETTVHRSPIILEKRTQTVQNPNQTRRELREHKKKRQSLNFANFTTSENPPR